MKIDRTKLKKSSSEVTPDCKALIDKLKSCNHDELLDELLKVKTWTCGKCELYHWIDVLDAFDCILETSCGKERENQWCLPCDASDSSKLKKLLLSVLHFTALLIEHSFSRQFYNSMEHLAVLLSSSDMNVVLAVLNLLYVFSKRSNFITRLNAEKRQILLLRLLYLAESWGGKENGFGLAECCQNLQITAYPSSASTLHFEYYAENVDDKAPKKTSNTVIAIHIDNVDKLRFKSPSQIMEDLVEKYAVPEDKQMQLFTHIRLAHSFSDYPKRMLCVQARLQALSVLVYCNAVPDNVNSLLYNGLIEELVDVLKLQDNSLIEIKAAALRTLTSIIHLDRDPKLSAIIDATGTASYHGFLPVLVRRCIQALTEPDSEPFPLPFATALFSFLYHLANYESVENLGGEALVSCGMVEALLKVINWHSTETEHITFVTRAVRVIDLITNSDMQAFQAHGGFPIFIQRLEMEVNICRKEQPFVVNPKLEPFSAENQIPDPSVPSTSPDTETEMEVDSLVFVDASQTSNLESESSVNVPSENTNFNMQVESKKGLQCFPQRAALLKSMLNFLKKSIQDSIFPDSIRHLMDGSLPNSLKHIISNAEYYRPSLFLLATDVVTGYVFQEPTLLTALQDDGLTDVVLHALLVKEIPATREVLSSLPNVFSALCLNVRGLQSFVACKPFEKLFRVLILPEYLPAMRRRRSSNNIGDAASDLGNAMDELIRHQPSLRTDAMAAIIKLLEELCAMGRDPRYICSKPTAKPETVTVAVTRLTNVTNEAGSSDEEDDEEEDEDAAGAPKLSTERGSSGETNYIGTKRAVPLVDYILNVMRFVDAVLSNNSTDTHCREFVRQKGLHPLMLILGLPNLPIDFPVTPTCRAVSSVCKSILNLAHEPQVLKQGLLHLNEVLQCLEPLHKPLDPPGGSVLLEELICAPNDVTSSAQSTPLLHYMAAAHAYIIMFVHVCKTAQTDIRTISISHWGSELGLSVLKLLSSLYTSLVWESTVLLALCSNENGSGEDCQFGRQQLERLLHKDLKMDIDTRPLNLSECGSSGVTSAMETLSTNSTSAMDVDDIDQTASTDDTASCSSMGPDKVKSKVYQAQIKQIKPLLSGASRLGRALADLFGLLVKLCVGSPMRQRRGQQIPPSPSMPSPAAQAVASSLTHLLTMGLSWEPPPASLVPKFRLTFYICSMGFTSPMLFDDRKYPYHLMLQKFLSCGGLDAFFNTFRWALTCGNTVKIENGLDNPQLPDGTGEFLDAWLMLLEKMVNPKNVLESPHTLPSKINQQGSPSFNPVLYLIHIHKRAFESIMYLWNKKPLVVYGERIAESMLGVICHLLKGESKIKERQFPTEDTASNVPSVMSNSSYVALANRIMTQSRRLVGEVNQDHLQQLTDMGFSRGLATEALLNTSSLEQATDFLLSYPSSLGRSSTSGNSGALGIDWEMSEEDQMLRAIAMSLGENVLVSTNQVESEPSKSEVQKDLEFEQQQEEPLATAVIDDFTSQIVGGCLRLADTLPETVYRICDLLISVALRNGEEWCNNCLIDVLLEELQSQMFYILQRLKSEKVAENKWASSIRMPLLNIESRFAVRLHLFTLIFEEMKIPCATKIEQRNLMCMVIHLLELSASCMNSLPDEPAAKWLPFLLLLIDQYEKAAVMSLRKAPLLQAPKRQWKWFDERSGRWTDYTLANNKLIDDAYKAGKKSLRFSASRRNYTVCLTTMVQINEETANQRPIMFTTDFNEEKKTPAKEEKKTTAKEEKKTPAKEEDEEKKSEEKSSAEEISNSDDSQNLDVKSLDTEPAHIKTIATLTPEQCEKLVGICVSLLNVPLEPDTLHAVMRMCLRLTRNHSNAVLFSKMNGPKILLSLTEPYAFTGFISLTALLFRHILEDPQTLTNAMEKVMRSATAPVSSSSMNFSREMHYVFRVLGPAACRDPYLFTSVAKNILRLTASPTSKKDEGDSRFNSHSVQMLKCHPSKVQMTETLCESDVANNLIYSLLNALIAKPVELPEEANAGKNTEASTPASDQQSVLREMTNNDLISTDDGDGLVMPLTIPNVDWFNDGTECIVPRDCNKLSKDSSKDKSDTSSMKNIPIIRKSGICRLLAELVRSYSQCAKLITEYSFHAGDSELITEDCTALAFILDNLLYSSQTAGDKDCPALSRVLIAAIASSNHSVDAQTSLVLEVRYALIRALSLSESTEKHIRIQALTGLVSTMIESCPSASSQNQLGGCSLRSQITMNNIVKILLRKGIVVDLARISHYLDLSSPHMVATVNSALKPLETLSRIVNLPAGSLSNKSKNRTTSSSSDRDAVPEPMEEDTSSARCSSDVTVTFGSGESSTETAQMETALRNFYQAAQEVEEATNEQVNADSSEPDLAVSVEMEDSPNSQIRSRRVTAFVDLTHEDQQESTDSDSNSDSGNSLSEDDAERDVSEEDVDADADADADADEEDDISRFEGGFDDDYSNFDLYHMDETDDSLFLQLEGVFPSSGTADPVRAFQLPVVAREATNNSETPAPAVPPAPQTVTIAHPLLVRHRDASSTTPRVQRRQRGFSPTVDSQGWHVVASSSGTVSGRYPNPPVILQRLLGRSTAQDLLRLTSDFSSHQTSASRRIVYANSDFSIVATEYEDLNANLSSDNYGTLSTVPSTLNRWTEESRVLDEDNIHDCVTGLKPPIIKCLEAYTDDEVSERKDKRRKLQDKNGEKLNDSTVSATDTEALDAVAISGDRNDAEPTLMEVSEPSTWVVTPPDALRTMNMSDESPEQVQRYPSGMHLLDRNWPPIQLLLSPNQNSTVEMNSNMLDTSAGQRTDANALSDSVGSTTVSESNTNENRTINVPSISDGSQNLSTSTTAICATCDSTSSLQGESHALTEVDESGTSTENPSSVSYSDINYTDSSNPIHGSVTISECSESVCTANEDDSSNSRTPDPTLISDDALPCERPNGPESDAPPDISDVNDSGSEIPEGVDPAFLAALPDNIRQEVIAEQLRLQHLRQRTLNISSDNTGDGASFSEVNPEFLAALPANIQEEVLAQRVEQQRLAAQNSNPDVLVDPVNFIQTLPQALRQQVLSDMDDSLLAILPPEVAAEAHALRRELQAGHQQIHERLFTSHVNTALSHALRSTGLGRVGARYAIHSLPHRGRWSSWNPLSPRATATPSGNASGLNGGALSNALKLQGRFLLDPEALACLLVLLFVDDPQLNTGRLHRVLRNLCNHGPTRQWVVKSLLSILERTKDYQVPEIPVDSFHQKKTAKRINEPSGTVSPNRKSDSTGRSGQPSWLSISLDAALGCRTNVFQIRRLTAAHRRTSQSCGIQSVLNPDVPLVTIHPLASPVICRHVLDTLIALAKSFPICFLPDMNKEKKIKDTSPHKPVKNISPSPFKEYTRSSPSSKNESSNIRIENDFWDVLVRLDSLSTTTSRKGKAYIRNHSSSSFASSLSNASDDESKNSGFESSPFAQLLGLLAHPVRRSSALTDRLLRLLALISLALPEPKNNLKSKPNTDFRLQIMEDTESTCISPFHEEEVEMSVGAGTAEDPIIILEDVDEHQPVKHYLKMAVEVLTSKTCSEEGLEDATALLLRVSRGCLKTRRTVLYLLLDGARHLGSVVCCNILSLMHELKYNLTGSRGSELDDKEFENDGKIPIKGTIQDRFTNTAVVIAAPVKIKGRGGKELQLPSMQTLTSKASSQAFFLRILKVIIQLTESSPLSAQNKSQSNASENTDEGSMVPGSSIEPLPPTKTYLPNGRPSIFEADGSLHLSTQLKLDKLWSALSSCLSELAETPDNHAVLVLQPAVEAFFLVHASSDKDKKKENKQESQESEMAPLQDIPPASPLSSLPSQSDYSFSSDTFPSSSLSLDTVKFLRFAEAHRTVLNHILRQSSTPLADGPFSVLVDHTRILDFDVKRRYFRQELERMDEGSHREDLAVHVRREQVFEDSFRDLHRRTPEEWKNRFYIVFEGEEGQDAGGLLREWYTIISREIFNPMYALFTTSPGDRVTYMINSSSHCNSNHLSYFKFVGHVIAKAVYDNKLLESYFTRSFYKHILGKCVKYTDMESEDYSFYQGLVFLLEHSVKELGYELTFSVEVQEFGVTDIRDLKPNGRNIPVCEENKNEYVRLVCQEKMTGAIRKQLKAFLEGFYEIIPKNLISIFNEQELELLISGLPNIDIDDLKANTQYYKYQQSSLQIQWFWRALRSFDQADRAKFLQFVTGTSKVPLQGFASLEGMNGTQKFQIHKDNRSTDRLPSAHTCFNQLLLPAYETYDKLRSMLLKAIHECSEGFGFA